MHTVHFRIKLMCHAHYITRLLEAEPKETGVESTTSHMAHTHPAFPKNKSKTIFLERRHSLKRRMHGMSARKGRGTRTSEPFAIGRSYSLRPGSWDHNTIQNDGWKARCWACTHDRDNAATNQSVLVNTLMDKAARREYRMCSGAADIGRVGRGYAAWR